MATTNDEMQKSVKAAEQVSQKGSQEHVTESQVADTARSGARSGANIVVPENEAAHLAESNGDNAKALPDAEAQAKIDEELEELFAEAEADEIPEAAQDVLLAQADSSDEEAMAEEGQAEGGEGDGDGSSAAGDGAMSAGQIGLVALGVAGVAAAAGSSSSSDGDAGESTTTDTITSDTTEITGARDGEDVTFEVTSLPDAAIAFDIGNTNSVTFNFTGDAVDGTLRLDADSSLNGDVVVTDGTLNVADADVSGVTSFEANSEVVITPSQLKALLDANEDFVISSNSTEESSFTLEKRTDADVAAYNELVSQGGLKVAGAGASTIAFVPLVSENFDGDADAASEAAEQEIAAVSEGATFTLTTSLSLNANDNLPSEYSIDTSETNDYGALTVSEALAESNTYDEITEAATNAEELADINLAVWSIEDSAANIVAASEESYVTGASTISVTDSVVSASDFATLSGLDSYSAGDEVVTDTLENIQALEDSVLEDATAYTLTDESLQAADVSDVAVADLADEQAAAVQAVRDGAVVAGAENGDTIDVANGSYTLDDSAANVLASRPDSDLVAGADSVSVTDEEVSREQFDQLSALTNVDLTGVAVTNSAPTAEDTSAEVTEGGEVLEGQLDGSDVDTDLGDELTFALAEGQEAPAGFTLNEDGTSSFDPTVDAYNDLAEGETREVTVDYTVTDTEGESAEATLTVTVTGTDDAPVATVNEDVANALLDPNAPGTVLEDDADPASEITDIDGFGGGVTVTLAYAEAVTVEDTIGTPSLGADFRTVQDGDVFTLIAEDTLDAFDTATTIGTITPTGLVDTDDDDDFETQTGYTLDLNGEATPAVLTALLQQFEVQGAADGSNTTLTVSIDSDGGADTVEFTRNIEGANGGVVELTGTETALEAEVEAGDLGGEDAETAFVPFGGVDFAGGVAVVEGLSATLTSDNEADTFSLEDNDFFEAVSGQLLVKAGKITGDDDQVVGTIEGLGTNDVSISLNDELPDGLDEADVDGLLSNLLIDLQDAVASRSVDLTVTAGDGLSTASLSRSIDTLDAFTNVSVQDLATADSAAEQSTAVELSGNVLLTVDTDETFNVANQIEAGDITGTADLIRVVVEADQSLADVERLDQLSDNIGIETVDAGATLTLAAGQVDFLTTNGEVDGAIAVTGLEDNLDADFTGITADQGVTATIDTSGDEDLTFTGDLGTAELTVDGDGTNDLIMDADIADGQSITIDTNETLVLNGVESDVAYDFSNITANGTFQVLIEGDVTLSADADLAGAEVRLAEGASLTGTAAQLTGLTITDDAENATLTVTDLAEDLDANLLDVTLGGDGSTATAQWDNTGLKSDETEFTGEEDFTGNLGDVTLSVAEGALFTSAASVLNGSTVEGAGSVLATDLTTADTDLSGVSVDGTATVQASGDLNDATDLGEFEVVAFNDTLTLTADQASGQTVKAADSFDTVTYTGLETNATAEDETLTLTDSEGNDVEVTVETSADETLSAEELASAMAAAVRDNTEANALVDVSVDGAELTVSAKEAGSLQTVASTGDDNGTEDAVAVGTVVIADLDGAEAYDFSGLTGASRLGTADFNGTTATLTADVGGVTLDAGTDLGDVAASVGTDTLTLTADQADESTITATTGSVVITDLDGSAYDFTGVESDTGDVSLLVEGDLTLSSDVDLSTVTQADFNPGAAALTLTASQADSLTYTGDAEANVVVNAVEATEGALLLGTEGDDEIAGTNAGDDLFIASDGADAYTLSGGSNTVAYSELTESGVGAENRDTISGFDGAGLAGGDIIDLSALGTFTFIDTDSFDSVDDEAVRYQQVDDDVVVEIDTDNDNTADMQILVEGVNSVTGEDFNLGGGDPSVTLNVEQAEVVADESDVIYDLADGLTALLASAARGTAADKNGLDGANTVTVNDLDSGDDEVVEFNNTNSADAATSIDFTDNAVTLTEGEFDEIDDDSLQFNADNVVTVNAGTDGGDGDIDASAVGGDSFVLNGDDGDNTLIGGDGDDEIDGGAGEDEIVADETDTIDGGADTDTVKFDAAVTAAELADGDLQNVQNVEITNTGDAAYDFSNQTEALDITGNTGADTIIGGAGADTLTGGTGADTFVFSLFSDNGSDTIEDFEVGTDDLDVSASVTGGNVSGEEDVNATNAVDSTADDELYVFADASQDIADADGSGVAKFGNLPELADFLDEAIDSVDGEEYLAVLNNGEGDLAKVVHVEGAADITFSELTVIGTVATDGAIDAADMTTN